MQYIPIKREIKNDKEIYTIPAIPLKNSQRTLVQKIPHPLGSDTIVCETLEEAKDVVTRAGFSYILPNGQKGTKSTAKQKIVQHSEDYEKIVLDTIKNKINSSNSSICAAAILAIAQFPSEETFDILFDKIGEENDQIRKNAISGICRYGQMIFERIIEALKSSNWVTRNSALTCISELADRENIEISQFIIPLSEICNDSNTIVQANALTTLAKVYQQYKKNS